MRTKIVQLILFCAALVILLNACAGQSYLPQSTNIPQPGIPAQPQVPAQVPTVSTPQPPVVVPPTPVSSQPQTITIQNFAFNPSSLTIKAGSTVIWKNLDSAPHKIKSDIFNSNVLNNGDTFSFKFDNKGTYNYSCAIHPFMQATITVE